MHPLSTTMQAFVFIFAVLALLAGDVEGRQGCYPFSCGHLQNISHPFRRRGDPQRCGVPSYELDCRDSKATIRINTGTYYVTSINYTTSVFWVVDASLKDTNSSCPLPRSDQLPFVSGGIQGSHGGWDLALDPGPGATWVSFVNCSQAVRNNSVYVPVDCLSTSSSFVYVFGSWIMPPSVFPIIGNLETSCRYLAMIPLGGWDSPLPHNASFSDIVRSMRNGFAVHFPIIHRWSRIGHIKDCLMGSIRILWRIHCTICFVCFQVDCWYFYDSVFLIIQYIITTAPFQCLKTHLLKVITVYVKLFFYAVLCRFVIAPLTLLTFLAFKYWKTRIKIDAVEKFLQMQLMLGPTRYAYTDIIAMTSHFRDKLGQGGYGSVFKGVILPGDVHVAIKMLSNYNCNGEEFISEVSTIGSIHHVNVVRLVGYCAEEMRSALVYEYMPHGSLDRFIFSPDKSLSWDKLNEIALGIARGINYLHQGCDMQILHFDIKPHNILLDSNFVPKVADFGLAKLYPRDNSFMPVSAARGTVGYIAPEMISRSFGIISSKSDVYSFGMLLLEMAGGRRNSKQNMSSSSQSYYPSWVYNQLVQQKMGEIANAFNMHELEKKLCVVGLHCIQMKSHDRPTMSEVIEMLEGDVGGLQLPSRPFFCDDEPLPLLVDSCRFSSELTEISEEDE
uniref:Receptor-like kinase n=1 Tax=Oryza sativa TaxID=4530 RepID=Q9LL53_ORYSA|nr:receptor-like kinase [Oryza sativa Japonica Group]